MARAKFRRTCRTAARRDAQELPELLKRHPKQFFWRLRPSRRPVEASLPALEDHFRTLLAARAPWDPPPRTEGLSLTPALTATELSRVLASRYRSGASSGLSALPSPCVRFLPPAVLEPLAAWLSTLPGRGLPTSWQCAALVPVWKGKGSPADASKHRGLSVLHPLAKLFSLCLLQRLDPLAEEHGWRARE